MKNWIIAFLLFAGWLRSEECSDSYFYFDVGSLALPVPVVGAGWRHQSGHFGGDLSLKSAILILPVGLRENVSFLYYPEPDLADQFYAGAGLTVAQTSLWCWGFRSVYYLGPGVVFGKSFLTTGNDRRFWQGSVDLMLDQRRHFKVLPAPILSFSYGICF